MAEGKEWTPAPGVQVTYIAKDDGTVTIWVKGADKVIVEKEG
jgi:hypothetical protein